MFDMTELFYRLSTPMKIVVNVLLYKERYIAGSSRCTTKPLSKILTSILTTVKEGLQNYCEGVYATSGVNQMWILKNSKDLLECLGSESLKFCNNIKTFDFSTLYVSHSKLKERLKLLIQQSFFYKNGNRRYKYLVLGHDQTYFVKNYTYSKNKYTETDIVKMLEFLIDNIFVEFWRFDVSTDGRHSNGHKLCTPSGRPVPLLV